MVQYLKVVTSRVKTLPSLAGGEAEIVFYMTVTRYLGARDT